MEYEILKSEAIVIKEREIGEADKLFTLYTENFGKINVLGKGIRKIKAKLKTGLQILNHISLEFVKGKNFFIATDAIFKNNFSEIKKEIKAFRSRLYICDILDELIRGEEKDKRIWNLFLEALNTLVNCQLTLRYFEWNLFSYLGFEPELYNCVLCRRRIQEGKIFFSSEEGGLICGNCYEKLYRKSGGDKKEMILKEISRDAIKILRLIILNKGIRPSDSFKLPKEISSEAPFISEFRFQNNKDILNRLRVNKLQEEELKRISKLYLKYILEKDIFPL